MLHALPIPFFLIWSAKKYLVKSRDHKAHCHAVFSTPVTSPFLGSNIILSTLFYNTLSWHSSHVVRDQASHPCASRPISPPATTKASLFFCIVSILDADAKDTIVSVSDCQHLYSVANCLVNKRQYLGKLKCMALNSCWKKLQLMTSCGSATSRMRYERSKIFVPAHKVTGTRVPDLGEADIQEILGYYVVDWTKEESEQLILLSKKGEEDCITLSCYI